MAVAVKNTPATGSRQMSRLPAASLVGVVYVLASLVAVFGLLPALWWNVLHFSATSFAAASVLGVLVLAAAIGLGLFGVRVLGARAPHGTRGGVFLGLVGLLFILLLTRWFSLWVEYWVFATGALAPAAGIALVSAFGVVLLAVGLWYFFQPPTERSMVRLEEQGWFDTHVYKPMQGQRVRRATILGFLLLAAAGIYTLVSHQVLRRGVANWELNVPFTGQVVVTDPGDAAAELQPAPGANAGQPLVLDRFEFQKIAEQYNPATHVKIVQNGGSAKFKDGQIVSKQAFDEERKAVDENGGSMVGTAPQPPAGNLQYRSLMLLPAVAYTVPLLILVASIWLAWRVVNLPVFADFLIATEAEMNKVSWTSRKNLVQDTVVVLVTVVLMAFFLFGTDAVWAALLRSKVINVLQINEQHQETTDRDRPLW